MWICIDPHKCLIRFMIGVMCRIEAMNFQLGGLTDPFHFSLISLSAKSGLSGWIGSRKMTESLYPWMYSA